MPLSRRHRVALLLIGVAIGVSVLAFAALPADQGAPTQNVTLHAPDGPAVTVQGQTNTSLADPFPDANTVSIATTAGNATFESTGRTNVTVTQITGTETRLSGLDVGSNDLTVNPEDKPGITVGGGATALDFTDATIDDGTVDFTYSASGSDATLVLNDLPAGENIAAVDDSTGTYLDAAMVNSLGAVTFTGLDTGTHDVRLITTAAPQLSDASPEGDLQNAPSQLQVNVTDADFPDGDSVTVNFTLDGSQVGSDTLTSNGTASTSISSPTGGSHTWTATATDDAGATTSVTESFGVPDELQIRNESDPSQLVSANVTLAFFSTAPGGEVIERSTTSGTIDMTGLPTESFFVGVETDGYYDRTIYIDSLYDQQNVFVLPENATSVNTRFVLEDFTGEYPEGSRLTVSRALNVSGTNQYRAITTDQFGTEGVTTTLEQDVRYRVSITAPDGRTQDLGPYRATTDETVTLSPGTGQLSPEEYAEGITSDAALDNDTLYVSYSDAEEETDQVTVAVFERGSEPRHYAAPNSTYTNLGNLSTKYTLTSNESDEEWVVLLDVERGDESFTIRHVVSKNPSGTPANLDPYWQTVFGVIALYIFGGIFSVLNRAVGALSVGIVGGLLWWTGWLAGATAGVAVVIYLFVAVSYTIYSDRRVG